MSSAFVHAAGLACPLGLSQRAAFASMHAGLRRFMEVEGILDRAGEPARGCRLASLPQHEPIARAIWFATHALSETVAALKEPAPSALPLYLAGPPELQQANVTEQLLRSLQSAPGTREVRWSLELAISDGRAGGARALEAALAGLERWPLVVAGGLDCQVSGAALGQLARHNLLLGRHNADGRLPGEGAAFLVLGRPDSRSTPPGALLHALSTARDPQPFVAQPPHLAQGLTRVFSALRATWSGRVDEVIAAQSIERFFGTELSIAYLRNAELMPEPMRVTQLAQSLGDCGAAAFPMGLACALDHLDPRPWRGRSVRSALVYSSSDDGLVGGAIVAGR